MSIRRLGAGDDLAPAVGLLGRFFAEEGFATDVETIARHAAIMSGLETCGLFVAEAQGEAIGVATVSLEFGIEYGWWAELGDLYVVPQWRGRGLSLALVEAAETFLRRHGASGYQVTVTPYASEAHDLASYYARLGFAGEGRIILRKLL
ncbi:MAG: GNAT family N-acetyltransferase [Rhizobiales bacterium]|nr:GNAT family N-acetyltransferase [Hyphomicrobiales bacterium]MBI3673514.1 GNAT family N-acetyltransferase [Hyphomicrobiales bacterium]